MKSLIAFIIIACAGFLFSCKNENFEDVHPELFCDTSVSITFTNTISPILQQSCGTSDDGCHSSNGNSPNLNDYQETKQSAEDGAILKSVKHTGPYPMPKDRDKLDGCTIMKIEAWVNRGDSL
jgi:hypothetical protein